MLVKSATTAKGAALARSSAAALIWGESGKSEDNQEKPIQRKGEPKCVGVSARGVPSN